LKHTYDKWRRTVSSFAFNFDSRPYTAGNAFQSGLCAAIQKANAHQLTQTGGDALSVFGRLPVHALAVQWGTWASEGMAARLGTPFETMWKRQAGWRLIHP
jgi:hypothetical protein